MKQRLLLYFLSLLPFVANAQTDKMHFPVVNTYQTTDALIDTLLVQYNSAEAQYSVYWRGDSLTSNWHYGHVSNFVTALKPLGLGNSFLLSMHAGDGCPELYQILTIEETGTARLSDGFGNCNFPESILIKGQTIEFNFAADKEVNRKKQKAVYDAVQGELKVKG